MTYPTVVMGFVKGYSGNRQSARKSEGEPPFATGAEFREEAILSIKP